MISKAERSELRSVVKQQFKVLRAEIRQREAELRTDASTEFASQSGEVDKQWETITFLANEAVSEANRKINDVLREQGMAHSDATHEYRLVDLDYRFGGLKKKTDHSQAQQQIELEIRERVKRAELALERQEADLLKSLAVDALESEEARAFLSTIPSVGELVPSIRLAELVTGQSIDTEGKG